MAAIPDAGGARCAPRGVLCALLLGALLRIAVVGGLAIAGWLLGSGIGQAHDDLVHQDPGQQDNSMVRLVAFPTPDDDSRGLLGAPPTVKSTVTGVVRAVPRLPVRPPQVPVLAPVLAPVSKLAAPAHPVAKKAVEPQATNHKPAAVTPPPAASAEPAVPATTLVRPAPVQLMHNAPAATPVCAAAHPVADPLADQLADPSAGEFSTVRSGPVAPAPAGPFGTTTAPCPSGSTGGGGAITGSGYPVTVSDGWAGMDLASTYCRLCADASGILRAAAQRPSTSPD